VDLLSTYGQEMGIAFQLADDVLDIVGNSDEIGKPVGTDLTEGVYTLPVLIGLASPRGNELREILADRPGPDATTAVRDILESVGALEGALSAAADHLANARAALSELPAGPVTTALEDLGAFLVTRASSPTR
jgi:geranylgeranyl pyrophosphate synthase